MKCCIFDGKDEKERVPINTAVRFTFQIEYTSMSIKCARGVMGIVAGNGHGDTSSNPERDWLHFT